MGDWFSRATWHPVFRSGATSTCSFFFFVILHTLKNCYHSSLRAPIWLKFGTQTWGLNANTRINYGLNLINIYGVISDFMHRAKSIFCNAYSVNHCEKQAENC